MATKNSTIIKSVYLNATNDFQQRIPDPSQAGITQTVRALFEPANRPLLNQFMDILINRIGLVYVHNKRWENPLAVFKKSQLTYGTHIEEIALSWLKAHSYRDDWGSREDDVENLLKVHRPDGQVAIHSLNRQDTYPISVNYEELRGAFTDEYGLNSLIAAIMDLPINSSNYDEYRIMLELVGMYEQEWGFFKEQLSAAPTTGDTAREMLMKLRTYAGKLQFPSSLYNAATVEDIPVFANPAECVLITTPEVMAALDVLALAELFNVDRADIMQRVVLVDEFPIPNAQALLTTEDFFVVHDYLNENTSFFNPQTLTTNYYFHVMSVNSVSPFVPAILFTTDEATVVPEVTLNATGLNITPREGAVEVGGELQITTELIGELSATAGTTTEGIEVAPDSVTWQISATLDDTGVAVNPATTYIDRFGVFHCGEDVEDGTVFSMLAMSTYLNPSTKMEQPIVGTATITASA